MLGKRAGIKALRATALASLLATAVAAWGQVTIDISIDSLQLYVGEQTGITLDVSCDAKQSVVFPPLQPGAELVPDVEVVKVLPVDTTYLNERKRMQLTLKYIVTAWDSALYYLPPMEVSVGGKKYSSKSLALKVYTVDVDTTDYDAFFGPKGEMDAPFSWEDWRGAVWASLAAVLLLLAAVALIVSLKTGAPLIRIIKKKPKTPPHQVALMEIARIKAERIGAQEDSKEYYTQLTDTLRTYIKERYKFNATEMTSGEIIERLTQENDESALAELSELFRTADLVKFAKYSTLINENDANLMTALQYINQTKVEPRPEDEQEQVTEVPGMRNRRVAMMVKRCAAALCIVAFVACLCWVVYRMADLLM